MTGPEHYRSAEELLAETKSRSLEASVQALAQAQVHATLALAAATVECATEHPDDSMRSVQGNYITQGANAKAWQEATA